jgi:YVTN family beta-propeller protein
MHVITTVGSLLWRAWSGVAARGRARRSDRSPPQGGQWEVPALGIRGDPFRPENYARFPLAAVDAGDLLAGEITFRNMSTNALISARTIGATEGTGGGPVDLVASTRAEFERQRTGQVGFRVVDFAVVADPSRGPGCMRYEVEHEVESRAGQTTRRDLVATHGIRCLHPQWPAYAIDMGFSRRHREGERPSPTVPDAEIERVFSSLAFTRDRPVLVKRIVLDRIGHVIAAGQDSVWVTHYTEATFMTRIDPVTNEVVARVPVGSKTAGIAVGGDSVWVADDDGTVSRISLQSNQVVATVRVGQMPTLVAIGAGAVWVTNNASHTVSRIDPATNQVTATIPVGRHPSGIAIGEGAVWVTNAGDRTISRIDPVRNEVVGSPVRVDAFPRGYAKIAAGAGGVWVTMGAEGLAKIDPRTSQVIRTWKPREGAIQDVVVRDEAVWAVNRLDSTLVRIDPRTGEPASTPVMVRHSPWHLAMGPGGVVWTTNVDRFVSRFQP